MAWNYRKRVKIAPGVHLNFSKSGVSTSIGPKGAKISIGKRGTYLNTGIPGTGLYSRTKLSGNARQVQTSPLKGTETEKTSVNGILVAIALVFFIIGLIIILNQI